jgi:hypothetical protein
MFDAFEAARGAVPVGTLARAAGAREVDAIGGAEGTIPPLYCQSHYQENIEKLTLDPGHHIRLHGRWHPRTSLATERTRDCPAFDTYSSAEPLIA